MLRLPVGAHTLGSHSALPHLGRAPPFLSLHFGFERETIVCRSRWEPYPHVPQITALYRRAPHARATLLGARSRRYTANRWKLDDTDVGSRGEHVHDLRICGAQSASIPFTVLPSGLFARKDFGRLTCGKTVWWHQAGKKAVAMRNERAKPSGSPHCPLPSIGFASLLVSVAFCPTNQASRRAFF